MILDTLKFSKNSSEIHPTSENFKNLSFIKLLWLEPNDQAEFFVNSEINAILSPLYQAPLLFLRTPNRRWSVFEEDYLLQNLSCIILCYDIV